VTCSDFPALGSVLSIARLPGRERERVHFGGTLGPSQEDGGGGGRERTEEGSQETWLIAGRGRRTVDPARGACYSGICGIASNAAGGAIRARVRRKKRDRPLASVDDRPALAEVEPRVAREERVELPPRPPDLLPERRPQPGRVALHYHNDSEPRRRERDAVHALLTAVPGIELLDPGCEEGWGRSCTWPAGAAAQQVWRARAARQLQTAVDQRAETLATLYHGCQRLLCGYEADYPLNVEHYLTLFARALAMSYEDQYKQLLMLGDVDAVMAEVARCMQAHQLDEGRVRDVVRRQLAGGKGV